MPKPSVINIFIYMNVPATAHPSTIKLIDLRHNVSLSDEQKLWGDTAGHRFDVQVNVAVVIHAGK